LVTLLSTYQLSSSGRQRGGGHGVVGNGTAVDVDALDQGFHDALGQFVAHLGHRIAHIRHRAIDRRADLEFQCDVDGAFDDVRGDIAYIADARNRTSTFCAICVSISVGAAPGCEMVTLTSGNECRL